MISEVESRRVILQLANEHVLTSVSEFKSRWVILQLAREHVQTLKSEFKSKRATQIHVVQVANRRRLNHVKIHFSRHDGILLVVALQCKK